MQNTELTSIYNDIISARNKIITTISALESDNRKLDQKNTELAREIMRHSTSAITICVAEIKMKQNVERMVHNTSNVQRLREALNYLK